MRKLGLSGTAVVCAVACGGSVSVFGGAGSGGGSASGAGGSSLDVGVSSSKATTNVGTNVSASQATVGTTVASSVVSSSAMMASSSGAGGAPSTCAHDECKTGPALTNDCDACVTQLCNADPYCCKTNWDFICVGKVWSICKQDCNPNGYNCDKQYMANTAGYQLCWQGADCGFAFNSTIKSCAAVCAANGGECTATYNDQGDQKCTIGTKESCLTMQFNSAVCVCSRGCGNGPPCGANQKCTNGQCN